MEIQPASGNGVQNPKEEVDEVVNTWIDVIKTPTISGGYFVENEHFIDISTQWSVIDIAKKENASFHRTFSVLKSSLNWKDGETVIDDKTLVVSSSASVPFEGKKICISKDGNRKAILGEKKPHGESNGGTKTEILQIWSSETLIKTYDLTELDKHKSVYTSAGLGSTMTWSNDSKKLAYLAEKKVPKPKPFFTSNVKKDQSSNEDKKSNGDEAAPRGEEFAFKQSWGEQLKDLHSSVIVILDTETDKFEVIELPGDEFPSDIQWVNDASIVGNSVKIPIWRLGLIYCTNRESRIFQVGIDGKNLRFLSTNGRVSLAPRVRPDGEFVIWQERAADAPHDRARSIMGLSLSGNNTGNPICLYEASPTNEIPAYLNFSSNCWSPDGSRFFIITPTEGYLTVLNFSVNGGTAKPSKIFSDCNLGVDDILWISNKYMLIRRSNALQTPSIELVDISNKDCYRRAIIKKSESAVPNIRVVTELFFGESTAPSIYNGPDLSSVQPNSVPLIVWPHGGPHSVFLDNYMYESTFFLRLGFAILKLNYVGGLGTKQDETDKLLGNVGTLDVNDCQNITKKVLQSTPSLNPSQVFVFGGSHGGFLTAHLTSSFPEFYKAAVMRNPVCDMNVNVGTTDITDWVLAETGRPFPESPIQTIIPAARSLDEADKYIKCSPITYASKVLAPTLVLLGSEDLRVPMSQGMGYYRALKAHNKTAEVRIYPDCHPLSTVPVRTDSLIHSALWFKRFMK